MASLLSHPVASFAIGAVFSAPPLAGRAYLLGAAFSILPDLDVVGLNAGIPYGAFWGHRGFTHSLLFAALVAAAAVRLLWRNAATREQKLLWLYFFLATASHGLLDAITDGGLGVAFFSPFDQTRYFLPWRPLPVSPIGIGNFLSSRGLAVLRAEIFWIWLPAALLAFCAWAVRRSRASRE